MKNFKLILMVMLALAVFSGKALAENFDFGGWVKGAASGGWVRDYASQAWNTAGTMANIGGAFANIGYTKIQNSIGTNINDMVQLSGTVAGIGKSALDFGVNTGIGVLGASYGAGQWTRAQMNNIAGSGSFSGGSKLSAISISGNKIIPGAGSPLPRISPQQKQQREYAVKRENFLAGINANVNLPRSSN